MKTSITLLATTLLFLSTVQVLQARGQEPPSVKLLPLTTDGMLRVLVNNPHNETVRITFTKGNRILGKDKIHAKEYEKGFYKTYDLRPLKPGNYTIEVETSGVTTTYDLKLKRNKQVWAYYWDNYLQKEQQVALR